MNTVRGGKEIERESRGEEFKEVSCNLMSSGEGKREKAGDTLIDSCLIDGWSSPST